MSADPIQLLRSGRAAELRARYPLMGGEAEVQVCGMPETDARVLMQRAIDETRRIEAKYSRYRPDSVIAGIVGAAGSEAAVRVDEETASLLEFAEQLYTVSEGRFDITSGVLRHAWDFRAARVPDAAALDAARARVGWSRVQWNLGDRTISLAPGMELDFGGFGKEYAADRAAALLIEGGASSGYVNLSGDLRVLGPRTDGRPWRFGIQHPRTADAVCAAMELSAGALATSGDYERFFECEGRRYCHVLDARSGTPVQHWRSVSVVAPLCIAAGALATCTMLMEEQGLNWLEAQRPGPAVDYLAIDHTGQHHTAPSSRFHWNSPC
jgi:thiamine biosynthesis lipoprotein